MRRMIMLSMATALAVLSPAPTVAQTADCTIQDTETRAKLQGVTLTWTSSFRCNDAPRDGTYQVTVTVQNRASSAEAVRIDRIVLSHTTPRPQGNAPDATAQAGGLPVVVSPGETEAFQVSGSYELVRTDEGEKANLHLRAIGRGVDSGDSFRLGINVHLRG